MTTEPMTDPFRSWTAAQIARLPEVGDVVREWEKAREDWEPQDYFTKQLWQAGAALAAEVERLRAMVAALEQETHALRGLVERARDFACTPWENLNYGGSEWLNDADRILAPDTGEDEK